MATGCLREPLPASYASAAQTLETPSVTAPPVPELLHAELWQNKEQNPIVHLRSGVTREGPHFLRAPHHWPCSTDPWQSFAWLLDYASIELSSLQLRKPRKANSTGQCPVRQQQAIQKAGPSAA